MSAKHQIAATVVEAAENSTLPFSAINARLLQQPQAGAYPIPPKFAGQVYVSPAEAAEILGIDRSTLYRQVMPYAYSGVIESLKIGGCRRIHLISLLAWAETRSSKQ